MSEKFLTKKSLGQNFLNSQGALQKIVTVGELEKKDVVLEIGPGLGALTEKILATGARVVAVEKDDRLIEILGEKFASEIEAGQLKILHQDILEVEIDGSGDFTDICGDDYKLIANIPYYITGQILRKFLETERQPKIMVVLVQKEVAERIVARDRKESLLSVSVKVFGESKLVSVVKAGSFNPAPKVDSAILQIKNISRNNFDAEGEEGSNEQINFFFEVLRLGFAHKRKTLMHNLKERFDAEMVGEVLDKLGVREKVRAEDLTAAQWLDLTRILGFSRGLTKV
jgi:dimethyladenosine transferase